MSRLFGFTMLSPRRLPPFLAERLERVAINGSFHQLNALEGEGGAAGVLRGFDFLVVSASNKEKVWLSQMLHGVPSAEKLDLSAYAPFLQRVAIGEEAVLATGDAAVKAAGLKEMSLGFGGGAGGMSMMGETDGSPKRRKKAKKAKRPKDEL